MHFCTVLTGGKMRVHHYDPENKWQCNNSPQSKKLTVQASERKVMMTTFRDTDSIALIDILKKGAEEAEGKHQKGSQPQKHHDN